jgi:hypothetical protein
VHKQLIAFTLVVPLLLAACSSSDDSNLSPAPAATDTTIESTSPEESTGTSDACAVIDQMQLSLSTALTDLVANPDLVSAFNTEFDNQVALLNDLVESLQGESPEQQKLQSDLDAALIAKEDAVKIFNDAQQEDNVLSKTLGMANAALSARDAITAADQVLGDLTAQLQCAP